MSQSPNIPIKEIKISIPETSNLFSDRKLREHLFNVIGRTKSIETLIISDGQEVAVDSYFGYQVKKVSFDYKLNPQKKNLPSLERYDQPGVGYFLCNAIKSCQKLRHIELRNIRHLSKKFLSILGDDFLKNVTRIMGKTKITTNNQNSAYVIAMALKCTNLETLNIEFLEDVSKEAFSTLLFERKGIVLVLFILEIFNLSGHIND